MEGAAQRLGELAVGDRVRGGRVDDAPDAVVVQGPEEEPDHVLEMDPGHELLAAGDWPADAELERQQQWLEEAAVLGQHQAGPEDHHPVEDILGPALGRLPVDRNLSGEPLAGPGLLIEDLRTAVAVVPDRGLPDEDARLRRRRLDSLQQVPGPGQAALADPDLGLVGEALVDRLSEQVDDAVDMVNGLGRRSLGGRLPGVPADGGVLRPGALGIAGQTHDLVAPGEQGVAQSRADQAARSRNENSHGRGMLTTGAG
jgi:hypothetical protein